MQFLQASTRRAHPLLAVEASLRHEISALARTLGLLSSTLPEAVVVTEDGRLKQQTSRPATPSEISQMLVPKVYESTELDP